MTSTMREEVEPVPTASDRSAFDDAIAPNWDVLVRVAGRLAPPDARDDVLQEALTLAWRRWHTYDSSRGTTRAWLLAIVVDKAGKSWRRHRRWHPLDHDVPAVATDSVLRADVEAAVTGLPPRQRLAVQLRYYADLTLADIAQIMRCSEGTVKSTLYDARAALRAELGEDYR